MASHGAEGIEGSEVTDQPAWKLENRAAVIRFRRAAVALAALPPDADTAFEHASEAAGALLALGSAGDDAALRAILRPDPAGVPAAWTVACYQIGDLAPSALRDFGDPAAALATLASCGEPTHLAAELLVSTSEGLTWTAVARTGDAVAFQLLDASSARDGQARPPGHDPFDASPVGLLEIASDRWRALLACWDTDAEAGLTPASSVAGDGRSVAAEVLRRLGTLEAEVERLHAEVCDLGAQLRERQAPAVPVRPGNRLTSMLNDVGP